MESSRGRGLLLLLAALLLQGSEAVRPSLIRGATQHDATLGVMAKASCESLQSSEECSSKAGCSWCSSDDRAVCLPADSAQYLPMQFTCSGDAAPARASLHTDPNCAAYKEGANCDNDAACTWCTSSFGWDKGACYAASQAKFLPKQMFDCDCDTRRAQVSKPPKPSGSCTKAKSEDDCADATGCVWCTSSFGPGMCYEEAQAKYLPKQVYTCDDDDEAEARVSREPEPGPDPGSGCADFKDDDDCDDADGCVWCENQYGPAMCFDEAQAKYLPKQIFKCDKKDDHRSSNSDSDVRANEQQQQQSSSSSLISGSSLAELTGVCKLEDEDDCADDDRCTWCTSSLLSKGECFTKAAARILPPQVFQCTDMSASEVAAEAAEAVGDAGLDLADCTFRDEAHCDDEDCTWCVGDWSDKGACFGRDASKLIPPEIARCGDLVRKSLGNDHGKAQLKEEEEEEEEEASDHYEDEEPKLEGKGRSFREDCEEVKDDAACDDDKDCTWCTSSFMDRGACFPMAVAKYLPPQMFDCDNVPSRRKANSVCDSLSQGECTAPTCVWCTSAAVGGGCFTPEEAAKLPSAIFNCKTAPQ